MKSTILLQIDKMDKGRSKKIARILSNKRQK